MVAATFRLRSTQAKACGYQDVKIIISFALGGMYCGDKNLLFCCPAI